MDDTEEFLKELSHIQENLSGTCKEAKVVEKALKEEAKNVTIETEESLECSMVPETSNLPVKHVRNELVVAPSKDAVVTETSTSQMSEYVVSQIQDAVQNGMMTLKDIQMTVSTCLDGKVIKGYADLLTSIVKGLDTINNLNIAKQGANNAKELEVLKHQQRKEIVAAKNDNNRGAGNINVFVGGREALLKILDDKDKSEPYTEITSKDDL
jgi:hypothetical protein